MTHGRGAAAAGGILGLIAGAVACGGENVVEPPSVAAVEVTSPIGSLWDVGTGVQLAAVAKDAQGNTVSGVTLSWTSSSPQIVSVSPAGAVEALAAGSATIRAQASGVTGSLSASVVDADLVGIGATVGDAYLIALAGGTSNEVRTAIQAATAQCINGLQQGNLEDVQDCIEAARSEISTVTSPTDRALLAVMSLFVDHIERLLSL